MGFILDTPAQDRDFLFKGGQDPNVPRREELRSLATGVAYKKYVQNNSKEALKYGATTPANPQLLPSTTGIITQYTMRH